jgi:hypothetical protein
VDAGQAPEALAIRRIAGGGEETPVGPELARDFCPRLANLRDADNTATWNRFSRKSYCARSRWRSLTEENAALENAALRALHNVNESCNRGGNRRASLQVKALRVLLRNKHIRHLRNSEVQTARGKHPRGQGPEIAGTENEKPAPTDRR